jgi:hypothetical protein
LFFSCQSAFCYRASQVRILEGWKRIFIFPYTNLQWQVLIQWVWGGAQTRDADTAGLETTFWEHLVYLEAISALLGFRSIQAEWKHGVLAFSSPSVPCIWPFPLFLHSPSHFMYPTLSLTHLYKPLLSGKDFLKFLFAVLGINGHGNVSVLHQHRTYSPVFYLCCFGAGD